MDYCILDIEENCKMFNVDFPKDYYGRYTHRDLDGLGSSFVRGILNRRIEELEERINPPKYLGIKFNKNLETTNTHFYLEPQN